jgi:hypothetical protein
VLQHQFWDLAVSDEAFEVGLSFGNIPERLAIPFSAVTAFYDPAVQFGFQFEASEAGAASDASAAKPVADTQAAASKESVPKPVLKPAPAPEPAEPPPVPEGGGEVVRLDRFRKK